jgi:hypothetical protein
MKKEDTKDNLPAIVGPGDGFDDVDRTGRLIQGTIIRCVDGVWSAKDGTELPPDKGFVALDTALALQRWENGLPVETIIKRRGERLPDVEELNKKIPQKKWEKGIDGKLRSPWQKQYVVYLFDPATGAVLTYVNSTTGAEIAVEQLKDRVKLMRFMRGDRVVPIVKLDSKPMSTQFGVKQRPEFTILDWRELGGGPSGLSAGPTGGPSGAPGALEQIGAPVKPVSLQEVLDDSIDHI